MTERERFESWARQRWTHPEDFDQRIKAPSKYNNYEVQAAWDAWQERAAQPATSMPDGWKLVPRPPTPTMVKAGLESSHVLNVHRVLACYDAMIDAAPKVKL